MIKRIILITNAFPYGSGETFLEPEISCVPNDVEMVIVPLQQPEGTARDVHNCRICSLKNVASPNSRFTILKAVFSKVFFQGLKELKQCNKFSKRGLKELLMFVYSAKVIAAKIQASLLQNQIVIDEHDILYSYWMDSAALAAYYLANNKAKVICRAHGADLYDERTEIGHQFLRKYMCNRFSSVFPISKQGADYLINRTECSNKIHFFHLGVMDHGEQPYHHSNLLNIVSCSNVIDLKRLDIIIEALSVLKDIPYRWIHFGDGEKLEEIKQRATSKLAAGTFWFAGRVPNDELHRYYQQNEVSIFVNASDTEGIPVSIMEAISHGIPVIATDVGGTAEVVHHKQNGLLIEPGNPLALAEAIQSIAQLPESEYMHFRENARREYLQDWNAQVNFKEFYQILKEL